MKNLIKTTLLISTAIFLSACSTTKIDHSKPEMSIQEESHIPPRTFNQFHGNWRY